VLSKIETKHVSTKNELKVSSTNTLSHGFKSIVSTKNELKVDLAKVPETRRCYPVSTKNELKEIITL